VALASISFGIQPQPAYGGATVELDKKVYTWTDVVNITVIAPAFNYDPNSIDTIDVSVSTSGHIISQYKLVETGTNTGIFTGKVTLDGTGNVSGITSGIGPTDGLIDTLANDTIQVSFEFVKDQTVTGSAIIRSPTQPSQTSVYAQDSFVHLWIWQKGTAFITNQKDTALCMTIPMPSDIIETGKFLTHWVYVYTNTGDFIQLGFVYTNTGDPKQALHFVYNTDNFGHSGFIEPLLSVNGKTIEDYNPGDIYKFCIFHSLDANGQDSWYGDFVDLTSPANFSGPEFSFAHGDHIASGGDRFESESYGNTKNLISNMILPVHKNLDLIFYNQYNIGEIPLTTPSSYPEQDSSIATPYTDSSGKPAMFYLIIHYTVPPDGIKWSQSSQQTPTQSTPNPQQTQPIPITVSTDTSIYKRGDTIMVGGHIRNPTPNTLVSLAVRNPDQNYVLISQIGLSSNGDFSTTFVAGGSLWTQSGTYTVVAQYGSDKATVQFQFTYTTPQQTSPSQPSGIDVTITRGSSANQDCVTAQNCFSPNTFYANAGQSITWFNADTASHTVTSGHPSDNRTGTLFNSGLIAPDKYFIYTLSSADVGTSNYYCQIHPWMTGQIIVGGSSVPTSSITIVNTTYKVSPSTYLYHPFSIGCSATVNGAFSAHAGLGDNIMVFVFDQSNFQKYQNGSAFTAYYESGKIASGSFVLNLNSGNYDVVLSNTYSVVSTKNVDLQMSYVCNP